MVNIFGRDSKPCKVFEYGCLPPTEGEDALINEIWLQNKYWNKLVEIERNYRSKVREILRIPDDPVPELLIELENLRGQIAERRRKARSGCDCSDLEARCSEIKQKIAEAKKASREVRKQLIEKNKDKLDQLEAERKAALKAARRTSGLYWCNYGAVEDSYQAARLRAMRENTDLKFHSFDGTGKVTIRYQQKPSVSTVFEGKDTRLQIDPVPDEAFYGKRSVRRRLSRTNIRLRVTSDNRKPVWVVLPMVLHRPMPENGSICSASIVRERVGRKFRYKAVITVSYPEEGFAKRFINENNIVGVDIGWRVVPGGLRVAYWADCRGIHGDLTLSNNMVGLFKKLGELRSIRDNYFNSIKDSLIGWLAQKSEIVPEWLKEETVYLPKWRSTKKLASLVHKWRENRFPGDDIYQDLEYWLRRENHLYDWETNLRDQLIKYRREEYRKFAAWLSKTYDVVAIEEFDLRSIVRKPSAENGTKVTTPVDSNRYIASISSLRQAIENACSHRGAIVEKENASRTTIQCYHCGHVDKFNASMHLIHTCSRCGKMWDQDHNAALNLINRVQERRKHAS
ncbi:MAG: zinc ribbon domain-containing protein [Bacillota bacterium]|nr:zinc ribbon domain-containing protein [Bacillota bacterium]